MISRSQMRRQLRANGGIMNARQGYGIGSWVKEKIRKLIPNELADIAVKAAPFVAPFNPAVAGLMSGVGSFDKTGRVGDSLKKGAMNYAGGQAARYLGGADFQGSPFSTDGGAFRGGLKGIKGGFSSPLGTETGFKLGTEATPATGEGKPSNLGDSGASMNQMSGSKNPTLNIKNKGTGIKDIFQNKVSEFSSGLFEGVPLLGELPPLVQQQILVGGVTSAATYIYEAFIMEEPPQDENETMEEYLARRKENVGKKMRTYMDNYMAFDAEYSALDDAGKDAVVERYNKNMGGLMRRNYQTGGITMTNSLQQNIAQNKANQRARAKELEIARSRIPGYVAAEKVSAPTPAPMIEEIQETIQPDGPTIDMPIMSRPPDMSRPMPLPDMNNMVMPYPDMSRPMPRPGPSIVGNPLDKFLKDADGNRLPDGPNIPIRPMPIFTDPNAKEVIEDPNNPGRLMEKPGSEDIMSGFEKFYKENYGMGTPSTADVRTYKLPNGEIVQGSSTSMGQTNAYLKSIGQPPATDVNSSSAGLPGLQKNSTDEKKYGTTADGKTIDPQKGRGMYIDLLDVVKYDQPNVKLTGNESLAELERLAYPQYFNPDGTMKPEKSKGGLMRTGLAGGTNEEFQNYLKGRKKFEKETGLEQLYKDFLRMKKDKRIQKEKTMAAKGGLMRLNYMIGGEAKQMEAGAPPIMYSGNMDPNAQAGLPSVPGPMQMAEDGPEFDMRENGGFQPLGRQEGKDDVPAMLAKNEFVMTADAVRAAGGGSIQKGAQKMYDTMKKLESRVS